jgi:hypothetical protein
MLDNLSPLARRVFAMPKPDDRPQYRAGADAFTDDAALARIDAAYTELLAAGLVVEADRVRDFLPGVSRPMFTLSPAGVALKAGGAS